MPGGDEKDEDAKIDMTKISSREESKDKSNSGPTNIEQAWKRDEARKREDALLLMQG